MKPTTSLLACLTYLFPFFLLANTHGDEPIHNGNYLYFTENKGQWKDNILFEAQLPAARLFLESDKLTYLLIQPDDLASIHDCKHDKNCQLSKKTIRQHAFEVVFENSKKETEVIGSCISPAYKNYFLDNKANNWQSRVNMVRQVDYKKLYEGIDMRFYEQDGHLKYDFMLEPNANEKQICLSYKGIDNIKLEKGNLFIQTSVNTIMEQKPYAYQLIEGKHIAVACEFVVNNQKVTFSFPNGYNKAYELIIDPELVFASFSGSTADNWGMTATYDDAGHLYAGGIAFAFGYPTTLGAFQTNFAGGSGGNLSGIDITISKFSPDGSDLLYSTYLGGSAANELVHSLIINNLGELVIFGTTGSSNFPILTTAYDNTFNGGGSLDISNISFPNGSDIFVSKLSADGSILTGSTFIGGSGNDGLNTRLRINYADEARGEVMVDNGGNIYISSSTQSANFPTTTGVFQPTFGGNQDGCIVKLTSDLSNIIWSSFLGGTGRDAAYSVKVNGSGVYVCGGTNSNNFPSTNGTIEENRIGDTDGYIAVINSSGTAIQAATFLGTSAYDQSFFLDLDDDGNVYTVGQTQGNYPITPSEVYNNPNSGLYIHKLTPDLRTTEFSTVIGNGNGRPNISPTAFLVDICDRVYVSGWGGEVNAEVIGSTTAGLPVTSDAFQGGTDGSDFYFLVLAEEGTELEYATFFGGNASEEHVDGGTSRFDRQGKIYQAVCAGCGGSNSFPTTPGAWSRNNNSNNCNLGVAKFAFEPSGVFAGANASPEVVACDSLTVQFINTSENAINYFWDFGDGTTSTDFEPIHTFDEVRVFEIMLIASDPDACNIADTTYTRVSIVDSTIVSAAFTPEIDCFTRNVKFTSNNSPVVSYFWDFGDGETGTGGIPTHNYATPGTYEITLIAENNVVYCPKVDTMVQTITILDNVLADMTGTDVGCLPLTATFENNSTNAVTYEWDFGDGSPIDTTFAPVHTFTEPGEFTVTLTALNPETCNLQQTATTVVTVLDTIIIAAFDYSLPDPCFTQMVNFTTPLPAAANFLWSFGDGNASTAHMPTHTYTTEGTYEVQLIASSTCAPPDTFVQNITLTPPTLVTGEITLFPENGCFPLTVDLAGITNGQEITWDMGNGTSLTGDSITYTYEEIGNYVVTMMAIDTTTCNGVVNEQTTVQVYDYATALFSTTHELAEADQLIVFTNQSTNATNYLWDFGDGNTTVEESPQHQYANVGNYNICLTAKNEENCDDEICQTIAVIPTIHIGIPNAFTPNGDGLNDELLVEGRNGIELMELKIFNRWGELVFQTNDPMEGWSGIYKGEEQEMEVYVYTLVANLITGRQVTQQGNITLLK